MNKHTHSFIEVCAGAGGLSNGFLNTNFIPIFLNEIDKTCCKTLEQNHKGVKIIEKSMEDIDWNNYANKDIDVLMGGVPCQSFSYAGKRKGLKDKRGNLLLKFTDIVKILKPKVFLIENVKGLRTHNKNHLRVKKNDIVELIKKKKKVKGKKVKVNNVVLKNIYKIDDKVKGKLPESILEQIEETENENEIKTRYRVKEDYIGDTFEYIKELLENKVENINEYEIYDKILNSNDYEVPQNRHRLIIVGVRKDIDIRKKYKFPIENEYKPILKDVLLNCPSSDGYVYNKKKYDIMKLVPEGGCWVNLPVDIQKEYMKNSYYSGGGKRGIARRLSMNKPSLTLTTSPCQKQTERCHPTETRPLQILEYAKIQTFPEGYKFSGNLAKQYKQIGNAVPVKLAEHIAKSIKELLDED